MVKWLIHVPTWSILLTFWMYGIGFTTGIVWVWDGHGSYEMTQTAHGYFVSSAQQTISLVVVSYVIMPPQKNPQNIDRYTW